MATTYTVDMDMVHFTTTDPDEAQAYSELGATVTAVTEAEA